MTKVYEYNGCSTCKKALKFLAENKIDFEKVAIVDVPPPKAELTTMLGFLKAAGGTIKNLFNTSGEKYRELGVAEKLKDGLSEDAAIDLLSKNGKLIKRPFLLTNKGGLVGFKEHEWEALLLDQV